MTNEETYLSSRLEKNPFKVPEGYFDSLAANVMAKIPAQDTNTKTALIYRMRPWLYAAACMLIAFFSITFYMQHEDTPEQEVIAANDVSSDYYLDEVTNYAMVDNHEIYACLVGE